MAGTILQIEDVKTPELQAGQVVGFWQMTEQQRLAQVQRWDELRQYIYATDTTYTTGVSTPWKNRTTRPKLTFLYEKMLTNYVQKLLPNDEFFRWMGLANTPEEEKAKVIQRFMVHKLKHPHVHFRETVKKCLMDYLQCGNTFAGVEYVKKYQTSVKTKKKVLVFKGARPYRIDPRDVGMNPTATTYEDSYLVHRILMNRAQFFALVRGNTDIFDQKTIEKLKVAHQGAWAEDVVEAIKEKNRAIDGVSLFDHWKSGNVELIEYFGDIYNPDTDEYEQDMHIVVVDRLWTCVKRPNDTYMNIKPVVFAGYRVRPESIWCMGPLENLVGLQYRIDHLENAKSDALDLCVYPIIRIEGDASTEQYKVQPGERWYVPMGGKVDLVYPDARTIMFDTDIMNKEREMEEFAAVPRETAGFRTPGEKTGFEVNALLQNAQEMPEEQISSFETNFIEPILNLCLELNIRNLDDDDLKSMPPDDLVTWKTVTVDDLKLDGRLYPIGSKHSKMSAMKIQNVQLLLQTAMQYAPEHIMRFKALKIIDEEMGLEEDQIVDFGAGLKEQAAINQLKQQVDQQFARDNPNAQTTGTGGLQPGSQPQTQLGGAPQ